LVLNIGIGIQYWYRSKSNLVLTKKFSFVRKSLVLTKKFRFDKKV
jgi:hypothetical protein